MYTIQKLIVPIVGIIGCFCDMIWFDGDHILSEKLLIFLSTVILNIILYDAKAERMLNKPSPPVKGVIQYDRKNYDIPAMRFLFNENPINLINYDTVVFTVDRNAEIKDEIDE